MALIARKSIVSLPTVVNLPDILGKGISTREQVIINTFKDLNKGQNESYTESIEIMSGEGRNMKVGTGTIPQATSNEYNFSPGFNLPPTSSVIDQFGDDFWFFNYHVQVGLLEDANGFNFGGHGRSYVLPTGTATPEFNITLDFNSGVATVSPWDFCWLVLF